MRAAKLALPACAAPAPQQAPPQAAHVRQHHAGLAERGEHLLDVAEEQPVGAEDEHALALEREAVRVEQVGRPVQGDDGLAGAGATADDHDAPAGRADREGGEARLVAERRLPDPGVPALPTGRLSRAGMRTYMRYYAEAFTLTVWVNVALWLGTALVSLVLIPRKPASSTGTIASAPKVLLTVTSVTSSARRPAASAAAAMRRRTSSRRASTSAGSGWAGGGDMSR